MPLRLLTGIHNMHTYICNVWNRLGPKSGGCCAPFWQRGPGSSSNTTSPGLRPTSVPGGIRIHPAVWLQYTNVTDRQTGLTGNEPIGWIWGRGAWGVCYWEATCACACVCLLGWSLHCEIAVMHCLFSDQWETGKSYTARQEDTEKV